jgi:hypothetical protein
MFRIIPLIGLVYLLVRMQWLIGRRWLLWSARIALVAFCVVGTGDVRVCRDGASHSDSG